VTLRRLLELAVAVWILRWAAMEIASHAHRVRRALESK
jgi:hypothetical protein